MTLRMKRSWNALWAAMLIGFVVSTGCGGFTVPLGGGRPHGGYYFDDFYYDYGGCYYCKSSDDFDTTSLEEPGSWDAQWGSWERFVRVRVDFLIAERARGSSEQLHPRDE